MERLALGCGEGYVTFFSLENKSFYYIYRGVQAENLTPNWRRGAPLRLFKKLQFLEKSSNEEIRKIRREDFKQVFKQLNQIQKESNTWYSIQLFANKLSLSYLGQNEMTYEVVDCRKYRSIEKLCHAFAIELQKKIRQKGEPQDTIRKYQKTILKKEPGLRSLTRISSQSYHIIFMGLSYKVLSSLAKIFFTKDVVSLGLPYKASYHPRQLDKETPGVKGSLKVRRVMVITNISGGYLRHLNESPNKAWWDDGPQKISWKHVFGNFTKKRIEHLIEEEKIFQTYDLVIYRGHGTIQNGLIQWRLDDHSYEISGDYTSRYIHLSCLTVQNAKDDLLHLPFREAVLPIGFFPDRDDSVFIQNIFKLMIKEKRSFREACRESLWGKQRIPFFLLLVFLK